MGCSSARAQLAADVLLKSDLRGIDSHGVARLTGYVRLWEKKRINTKVPSGQWHTLRVDFKDDYFVVTFDGKKAFTWKDDTFKDAGKVGLWTKADSVTLFDDFNYGAESKISDTQQLEKEARKKGSRGESDGDDDDKK